MEDGSADLDLGSLDGLTKGSGLQVFRGSELVGRLQVTTLFRERARARVTEGSELRPKDEVRVANTDHLNALLQQADTAFNRGDPDKAIKLAKEAVRWGESVGVPPDAMAVSSNELGVLHMLRGEYGPAESLLYRAASAAPKTDPVYVRINNNLGVLAELWGDRDKAAARYNEALGAGRGADPGDQRQTVERNLARVRGSR
jgi:Flp pilus assembly protein TadD